METTEVLFVGKVPFKVDRRNQGEVRTSRMRSILPTGTASYSLYRKSSFMKYDTKTGPKECKIPAVVPQYSVLIRSFVTSDFDLRKQGLPRDVTLVAYADDVQ